MRRVLLGSAALIFIVLVLLVLVDVIVARQAPPKLAAPDQRATSIVIEKAARRLTLLRDGQPFRTYEVSLGTNPVGHKEREGDRRTPEGNYTIDFKNARSRFHLALRISYPNAKDVKRAEALGVKPGGDIMIHGIRNGFGWLGGLHRALDWTDGCAAVTDAEIQDIWALVDVGTPVEIKP